MNARNETSSLAMIKIAFVLVGLALLASCATTPQVPPAVLADLAPTGKVRVGINFQNIVLTRKDPSTGEPGGIAVDLARELGRRLGVQQPAQACERNANESERLHKGLLRAASRAGSSSARQ